jgi:hypothetical protein
VILGGLICFAIHFAIFFNSKSTHLTPYLAAGLFLFLHGLLNVRLYLELLDGGDEGNTMMLPFKTEKVDDGIEEMSEIESSTSV